MKLKLLLLALTTLLALPLSVSRAQQQRDLKLVNDVTQLPDRAKRFAVLIGVNEYDDEQIGALVGPANDMQMLEDALVANAGFDRNHIRRLTREQTETSLKPTRFNVLRALSNALKAVPADGLLVLAFSGHGTERNGRAFLLPADAQVNADIELLEASALEVAALKNMIRNRRSSPSAPVTGVAQVVVLLDACRNDPTSGKDTSINPLTPAYDFSLRNSNVKAFVTLYATALGARAYESRARRQGYFISEVVAALRGAASDAVNERGEITLDRLIRHVEDEVPARVAFETGNDQKPFAVVEGYKAADLVLAKASAVAVVPIVTPAPRATPVNAPLPAPSARKSVTGVALRAFNFETVTTDAKGLEKTRRQGEGYGFTEDINGVPLELVELAGGTFTMGSPASEADRRDDETPHQVMVSGLMMGKYEVTQAQWRAVAKLPKVKIDLPADPANFKGDLLPIERVSWEEAVEFCARLSRKTGRNYRLPTEAEWEYAARGGTQTPFAFGETMTTALVNYDGNYPYGGAAKSEWRQKTVNVGSLNAANALGLYDLHGNVWEWCQDWYGAYATGAQTNPIGSANGEYRVLRGGSWGYNSRGCRAANRSWFAPGDRDGLIGFRVVSVSRT